MPDTTKARKITVYLSDEQVRVLQDDGKRHGIKWQNVAAAAVVLRIRELEAARLSEAETA